MMRTLLAGLFLLLGLAHPVLAQEEVLLTTPAALREIFPEAASVAERAWRPSAVEQRALQQRLGRPVADSGFPFLLVYDQGRRFLGYALVTEERGKYRPITFMVGVRPDLQVRDVAVMVYRESRGGEVRRKRFLSQYRGKTPRAAIRTSRDITNISGATISVHSMNTGVRKALIAAEMAFGRQPPRLAAADLHPVGELR